MPTGTDKGLPAAEVRKTTNGQAPTAGIPLQDAAKNRLPTEKALHKAEQSVSDSGLGSV